MSERQRKILHEMTQEAESEGLYFPEPTEDTPLDWQSQYEAQVDEVRRLRQGLEDAAEDIRMLPVGWHILMPIVHKIDKVLEEHPDVGTRDS